MRALCFILSFFLLLVVINFPCKAYYYKQYTTSNSLLSNTVYHSLCDRKGYMWFFTDKGISKFDGESFKNFTVSDGLTGGEVYFGFEDVTARLWLYTANGIPCFIRNDTVFNSNNDSLLKKLPTVPFIESILQDKDSSIYIAYSDGPLIKIKGSNFKYLVNKRYGGRILTTSKHGDTLVIIKALEESYYINDEFAFNKITKTHMCFHDFQEELSGEADGVRISRNNVNIWSYKDNYLNRTNIIHLYFDGNENVFCATNDGIVILNIKTNKKDKLFDNTKVSATTQDRNGNYWITTLNSGVYCLNKNLNKIQLLKNINNYKPVLTRDEQLFFIRHNSIFYFDKEQLKSFSFLSKTFNEYSEPLFINDEYFVYRSANHHYCFNRLNHTSQPIPTPKNIYNISDTLMIAFCRSSPESNERIYELGLKNGRGKYIYLPGKFPVDGNCSAYYDKLYFICSNSIYQFDIASGDINKLHDLLPNQSPTKMYYFNDELVLLTNDQKIIIFDVKNDFRKKELTMPFICYNIYPAKGKFILNTNKGYYLVKDLNEIPNSLEYVEYPVTQPELSNLFISGNNIICNLNGSFYSFNDSLLNKELRKPEFFINSVVVNGKEYKQDDSIIKSKTNAHISLNLSTLKFNKINNSYEYRIIRDDTGQWYNSASDKLDIFLEHFGKYTLEVRATTKNSIASPSRFLMLSILPPYYYSFSFYLIVTLGLLTIIFFSARFYNQYRMRHFQNELNYLQLEHRAINSLLNPHFIFNAINNIQNLVNINSKDTANNYLAILSKLIRQNIENLQFNFIPVAKEIKLVKNYIFLQNLRFDHKIKLEILEDFAEFDNVMIPPLMIHTFVENSVVHGFKKEMDNFIIKVDLNLSIDDYLIIKIRDNGVGITKKEDTVISDQLSLGINFIRRRLKRLADFYKVNYALEINNIDEAGKTGTEVIIIIYARFKKRINQWMPP